MARTFYEFFAGGGMVRAGLGASWECLFANDIDVKKAAVYEANWGGQALRCGDIATLTTSDLPGSADLAWASFPCQDLSLAGKGAGLKGERSGTFWAFWSLMKGLREQGRAPSVVALENVTGLITSHGGADFRELVTAMVAIGYRVGAMTINAERFVPQSRPRVFFVCVRNDLAVDPDLISAAPPAWCSSRALLNVVSQLDGYTAQSWIWWRLAEPPARTVQFSDLIETDPTGIGWHTAVQSQKIIAMMSPINDAKLEAAKLSGRREIGGVYLRTRPDGKGGKMQRAEVRFDGISGCLRTPGGGSSRQAVMIVEGRSVRTRLLSPREAARLMGLPDSYRLPENCNDAYRLLGDDVVEPVARWLSSQIFAKLPAWTATTVEIVNLMPRSHSAQKSIRMRNENDDVFTSVELCAGGGGQALGVEAAGFEHRALVEIDPHCCSTLRLNRPNWNVLEQSLVDFRGTDFYNTDLVAGGLPCPPFSKAGKQLGINDERNMFPHGLRIVREIQPKAVFFENVRGMLDALFDDYRRAITVELEQLGYWVDWKLLQAADFGVSQLRPRVVMVALRKDLAKSFLWPTGNRIFAREVGVTLEDLMGAKGWKGLLDWKSKADKIAPTIVGGSKKHGGPDLGPTRARKAWAALGVNGLSLAAEAPDPDFEGMPRLTVPMVARLQGFPDNWIFAGKKTNAYRQVENAFPPPVAFAVAAQIKKAIACSQEVEALAVRRSA